MPHLDAVLIVHKHSRRELIPSNEYFRHDPEPFTHDDPRDQQRIADRSPVIGVSPLRNNHDITVSAAAQSGPIAFGEAGVTPAEIDIAMIYDSFSITVLTILEDLGFCAKGEGGDWVASALTIRRPTP